MVWSIGIVRSFVDTLLHSRDSPEVFASLFLFVVSGIVFLAVRASCHETAVLLHFLRTNKVIFFVFLLCSFVIWVSLAFNARYIIGHVIESLKIALRPPTAILRNV